MTGNSQWGLRRLAGIVLVVAFAALYLVTLDNGLRPSELEGGDLITHQYAQVQGRPSNAPGYPLYTMGGWLWFRLGRLVLGPEYNPIPILSSYSTLWALLALWLLYRLILEVTDRGDGGNWLVAVLATGFYGVTYFFWYYAVTTEQYTSAVAWTVAVTYLVFRWEHTRRDSYLLASAFLVGVGLAHMVTVLFAVPPLLWLILRTDPRLLRRSRLILAGLGLAILPLLSYAFVYYGGAAHPQWRGAGQWSSTWQWFWSFLSTRQGRGELTWSLQPFLTAEFPALFWREMTLPGLILGLVGLAALGRRRAIALYVTLAIYLLLSWVDRLGNWYQVIMPAYAILTLGIGVGVDWIAWRWRSPEMGKRKSRGAEEQGRIERESRGDAETRRRGTESPSHRVAVWPSHLVIVVTMIGLVIYRGVTSYPRADSSNRPDDTALTPGWAILADQPPAGTQVLGTLPEALALNYLTQVWGLRPDLRTVTSVQARELLSTGSQLLAVTQAALPIVPAEVSLGAHYSAWGGRLVGVTAEPGRSLPSAGEAWREQSWAHEFGGVLQLTGGRVMRDARTGELVVLLVWETPARPTQDWSVSVRLREGNQEIAQEDQEHPVAGAYPTTRWSAGEVIGDAYSFGLPAGAAPDNATVIVYRKTADSDFLNLDVAQVPLDLPEDR